MTHGLTPKQHQVLNVIESFIAEHGWPPSITQLVEELNLARSTVFDHIQALQRKGYIELGPTTAQQMRVVR